MRKVAWDGDPGLAAQGRCSHLCAPHAVTGRAGTRRPGGALQHSGSENFLSKSCHLNTSRNCPGSGSADQSWTRDCLELGGHCQKQTLPPSAAIWDLEELAGDLCPHLCHGSQAAGLLRVQP